MIAASQSLGGPNTSYVQGSALELPFAADAYDGALLILALHEHPEPERRRMLDEAMRVARRALIIAEYVQPPHPEVNLAWHAIRFIEYLAGPEHRAGFRDFVQHDRQYCGQGRLTD